MSFPQAPAKISDEKLYAQLYRGYLKACRSMASHITRPAPLPVSDRQTRASRVQRIPVVPKEPSTVRVRGGEESNCDLCGALFPSKNALFRHLRSVCWQKNKTELVIINPDNDPSDSDDPFSVLEIDSFASKSKLLTECAKAEGGLLPLGFIDMLGASEVPGLSFISPPDPIMGANCGDGKPKKERLNYQIEIRKQEQDAFADLHGFNIDPEYEKDLASQTRSMTTILDRITPGNMADVHQFLTKANTMETPPPIEDLASILAAPKSHLKPPPEPQPHYDLKRSKADAEYKDNVTQVYQKAAARAREQFTSTLQQNSDYKYYSGNLRRASLSNEPVSILKARLPEDAQTVPDLSDSEDDFY